MDGNCGGCEAGVPLDALDPIAVKLCVKKSCSDVDLSLVTAAAVRVYRTDGSTDIWEAEIVSQSEEELCVEHRFVAGELTCPGTLPLVVAMTVSGGVLLSQPMCLTVYDPRSFCNSGSGCAGSC